MKTLLFLAEIPASFDVPVIGPVTMPEWATTEEAACFFMGFATGAGIILFRAGLRWWKRADGGDRVE